MDEDIEYPPGGVMVSVYDRIWEQARPYLDTRFNEVHTSICTDFARLLLGFYGDADPEVVLPAIMLHDVGWKMVPEERQLAAFGPNATDREALRLHETEGARIARGILDALRYDGEKAREILSIIDGHDSRAHALSLHDSLVKDSDKLWRYTPTGVGIDHLRFGIERKGYLEWLGGTIDGWLFTPYARVLAREAFGKSSAQGA